MKKILLIGTGPMAEAYVSVLKNLNYPFVVVGRGVDSAKRFREKTGIVPAIGGIEQYLETNNLEPETYAIVATGTEALMNTMLVVLRAGIARVLIEKPAAISIEELLKNKSDLEPYMQSVYVAYNRRFYASVIEAQKLIDEDGGLKSMNFEFTEWSHTIEPIYKAPGVKENWFFANSTHVVDLAFFLAGIPKEWATFSEQGTLSWHSKSNFTGAGKTEKGVLFSYMANWESAGRWGIELLTSKRRIYLKPLEEIRIQKIGTVTELKHDFVDTVDKQFKPGLYLQVREFVSGQNSHLLSMNDHLKNAESIYSKILNN